MEHDDTIIDRLDDAARNGRHFSAADDYELHKWFKANGKHIQVSTDRSNLMAFLLQASAIIAARRPATPPPAPVTTDDAIVAELRKLAAGERGHFTTLEDKAFSQWLGLSRDAVGVADAAAPAWLRIAEAVQLQRAVAVLEAKGGTYTLIQDVVRNKWSVLYRNAWGTVGDTLPAALSAAAAHLRPDPHAETRQRIAALRAQADALEAEIA